MISLLNPLVAVVAVVLLSMAVFLLIRFVWEWFRGAPAGQEEPATLLTVDLMSREDRSWPDRMDQEFDTFVKQTGLEWSTAQALGMIALVGVAAASAMWLWRGDEWLTAMALLLGVALALAGLILWRARWRQGLQDQLPNVLYLVARSLRAGESLEQAMETVAEHGARPWSDEFRRGADKIQLGLAIPAALRGMANRIDLPDFNIFVTAVTLHRTVGGNLAVLLDRVAASVRDRNTYRGFVRAATALGRITGFFIAAAPPLIFFSYLFLQPEFISSFLQSPVGIRALWIALGLEVIGVIWMSYLMRIDY